MKDVSGSTILREEDGRVKETKATGNGFHTQKKIEVKAEEKEEDGSGTRVSQKERE